jgi:putative transposase
VTRKQRKGGPSALKEDPRVQLPPESKGQVWDCHLLTADTSDGTPFEIVPIVDERSRECLATVVERNISAQDVTNRLFDLIVLKGPPERIRSNNGAGSMAKAIDDWLRQTGVETLSVKRNSRRKNGGGSFSGELKNELIDKTTFTTLPEARAAIEGWRELHNEALLHHQAPAEEPCQSPRLQHSTGDDYRGVQTPRRDSPAGQLELCEAPGLPGSLPSEPEARQSIATHDSPAVEAGGGQSTPRRDSPVGELEINEAPGLPGSLRRGPEARQPIATHDSPTVEAGGGQSTPRRESLAGQLEINEAPGLPGSVRLGSRAGLSGVPGGSPAVETVDAQFIPQQPSLEDEFDAHGATAGQDSLEGGTSRSVQSEDPLDAIEADQSIWPQGSVRELAGAHGTGEPSRVVSAETGSVAPSLKPVFSPRHLMRTAVGEVNKTLVRSMEWVLVAVPILLVALVSLILVAPYFGWRVDTVGSGGMEPGLKVGSVVVTRPVQAEEISVGDVITFRSPTSGEITSRRVSAVEDGPSFRTESIANGNADAFVTPAQGVIGRVCFHVPFAGYAIQYLMAPICLLLLFVFGFSIVVAGLASTMLQLRRRPRG